MTNREQAVAERMLDEHVRPAIDEEVAVTEVRESPTCWVIGFNTVAYLETGSITHALVGLGPIIVNRRSGKLGSARRRLQPKGSLTPGNSDAGSGSARRPRYDGELTE